MKIQQEVAKNDLEAQRSEEQGKKTASLNRKEAEKRLAEEQARQRAAAKSRRTSGSASTSRSTKAAAEQAQATKAANEAAASAAEEKPQHQ